RKPSQRQTLGTNECWGKSSTSKNVSNQVSDLRSSDVRENQVNDQQCDRMMEPDSGHNKSGGVVVTSPSSSSNRSIFRSSKPRRSLQETISAFTASPKTRHILGAPTPKRTGRSSSSCAVVAKVAPLDKISGSTATSDKSELSGTKYRPPAPNPARHLANANKSGSSDQRVKQPDKKLSPLFHPVMTRLVGYSLGNASAASTGNTVVPKGILKAPQCGSAQTKSVRFPSQLEIHMKGLTQESQDGQMSSPPVAERSLSNMFETGSKQPQTSQLTLPAQTPQSTQLSQLTKPSQSTQPQQLPHSPQLPLPSQLALPPQPQLPRPLHQTAETPQHKAADEGKSQTPDNQESSVKGSALRTVTSPDSCESLSCTFTNKNLSSEATFPGQQCNQDHRNVTLHVSDSEMQCPATVIPETPNLSGLTQGPWKESDLSPRIEQPVPGRDSDLSPPPKCKKPKLCSP
ncbi:hypothetical protein EGW08_011013, partial [Elysia chlorotica]